MLDRLEPAEALELLDATPGANIPPDQAQALVGRLLEQLPALTTALEDRADERATDLAASHVRVREGADEIVRSLRVRAEHPVDVLGTYLYLPMLTGVDA